MKSSIISNFQTQMISGANDLNPSPHITLFTSGCNFRCGYCFNPSLVSETVQVKLSRKTVQNYVSKFGKDYPLVVVTGGEPLMHSDLLHEIQELKEAFPETKMELCSNGSFPEALTKAVNLGLFDSYRIDYKLPRGVESQTYLGVNYSEKLFKVEASISVLANSNANYEVRTVFHSKFLTTQDIVSIIERLSTLGVKNYGIIYHTTEVRQVKDFGQSDANKLNLEEIQSIIKGKNMKLGLYRYEQ